MLWPALPPLDVLGQAMEVFTDVLGKARSRGDIVFVVKHPALPNASRTMA